MLSKAEGTAEPDDNSLWVCQFKQTLYLHTWQGQSLISLDMLYKG